MSTEPPRANGRCSVERSCSAVTKYGSYLAVCDLALGHPGEHRATLANATSYSWAAEPW